MSGQTQWKLFLEGDKEALSKIFVDYHDDLYCYGMKISSNNDIVKDAIQDLFLKLWKNRQNLSTVQVVKPYLFKSLRHHIQDSLELSKPWQTIRTDEDFGFEVGYSHEDFLINEQVSEENLRKVIGILNQLTPRQREAIYLRYFEDLEFEAIAQVMDMNLQSVRNLIHRGMQAMRNLMVFHIFIMLYQSACFVKVLPQA